MYKITCSSYYYRQNIPLQFSHNIDNQTTIEKLNVIKVKKI